MLEPGEDNDIMNPPHNLLNSAPKFSSQELYYFQPIFQTELEGSSENSVVTSDVTGKWSGYFNQFSNGKPDNF